jgi:hypothetical protein
MASGLSPEQSALAEKILFRLCFPKGKVKGRFKSVSPMASGKAPRLAEKPALSFQDTQDAWQIIVSMLMHGESVPDIFAACRKALLVNGSRRDFTPLEKASESELSTGLRSLDELERQRETRRQLVAIAKGIFSRDKSHSRKSRLSMAIRAVFGVWQTKNGNEISIDFVKSYFKGTGAA